MFLASQAWRFLAEHHGAVAEQVKAHYVGTMSAVYLKQQLSQKGTRLKMLKPLL
jgi:hypothetical protein